MVYAEENHVQPKSSNAWNMTREGDGCSHVWGFDNVLVELYELSLK